MAATRPTISSLATFNPRPIEFEFGELFFRAASIRSFLPSSSPVHCGPRKSLASGEMSPDRIPSVCSSTNLKSVERRRRRR